MKVCCLFEVCVRASLGSDPRFVKFESPIQIPMQKSSLPPLDLLGRFSSSAYSLSLSARFPLSLSSLRAPHVIAVDSEPRELSLSFISLSVFSLPASNSRPRNHTSLLRARSHDRRRRQLPAPPVPRCPAAALQRVPEPFHPALPLPPACRLGRLSVPAGPLSSPEPCLSACPAPKPPEESLFPIPLSFSFQKGFK